MRKEKGKKLQLSHYSFQKQDHIWNLFFDLYFLALYLRISN